jgi:hypothetical protein
MTSNHIPPPPQLTQNHTLTNIIIQANEKDISISIDIGIGIGISIGIEGQGIIVKDTLIKVHQDMGRIVGEERLNIGGRGKRRRNGRMRCLIKSHILHWVWASRRKW